MASGVFQYPVSSDAPAVSSADSTANATIADVIGNKTDASQTTVGTTRSLMGYLKGVLTTVLTLAVAPTSVETGTAVDTTWGSYVQIVAASAAAIKAISISGSIYSITADATSKIELATGAGGAEVVCASHFSRSQTGIPNYTFFMAVRLNKAASTRVAIKPTASTGTPSMHYGYTIEEA